MQIENADRNEAILKEWNDDNVKKVAATVTTPEHAADLSSAIRDQSLELQPEVYPLRKQLRVAKGIAMACGVVVLLTFLIVLFWSELFVGAKLYAALGVACLAAPVGIFAVFRARAIRQLDAQTPGVVTPDHIDEAGLFVRVLGPVAASDGVAMFILAMSGGADACLAGWVVATGMSRSLSLIAVMAISLAVATLFALALRILATAFAGYCASIRAKKLVRRLAAMDFARFPEKVKELEYAELKLGPVAGHGFDEPMVREYVAAAAVILAVPALFGVLLLFRVYVANHEGAADLQLLLGVSALLAALAILSTALSGFRGHLLREEGAYHTALHRRFPTREAFVAWLAAFARWARRWGNDTARRVTHEIQTSDGRGDRRRVRRNLVIARPFPDVEAVLVLTPSQQAARQQTTTNPANADPVQPANDASAVGPKEVA